MSYKKISRKDLNFLISVCGQENVIAGGEIHEDFSHDELGDLHKFPEVLVHPANAEQISAILKYASEKLIRSPRAVRAPAWLVALSLCTAA